MKDSSHPSSPLFEESKCEPALSEHQLCHVLPPHGTQWISTWLWTVISNKVIECKRGGESCLPASSITLRDVGTSLIKIQRLGFQLMKHFIATTQSRVLEGRANAVSRVMACVIPIRISGHTQCWRLTGATQRRSQV